MREKMNSQSGRAEATAAFLLQRELSGSPVMIPGEFARRAGASASPPVSAADTWAVDHPRVVAVSDRERLVYEREGGGAPRQRSGGSPTGFFRKLWSSVRHRSQIQNTSPLFVSFSKHHEDVAAPFEAQ
jgi:hypothetical protein